MIAPEGTTKSGHCLLRFSTGAFVPGQHKCSKEQTDTMRVSGWITLICFACRSASRLFKASQTTLAEAWEGSSREVPLATTLLFLGASHRLARPAGPIEVPAQALQCGLGHYVQLLAPVPPVHPVRQPPRGEALAKSCPCAHILPDYMAVLMTLCAISGSCRGTPSTTVHSQFWYRYQSRAVLVVLCPGRWCCGRCVTQH